MIISSRHNPLIRDLRVTVRAPSRRSGVCVLEGWRLVGAAIEAGVRLEVLVLTPEAASDPAAPARITAVRASAPSVREITVTPAVFAAVTQVEAPQGVLGIAPRPAPAPLMPGADQRTLAV